MNNATSALTDPARVMRGLHKRFEKYRRKYTEQAYVWFDSNVLTRSTKPVLFVDAGSNLGQGFQWFSTYYGHDQVSYHLFEPNPNCHPYLDKLTHEAGTDVQLYKSGVGAADGTFQFFGLSEAEGGELSQGGSINPQHNSDLYAADTANAINVDVINFGDYLKEQSAKYQSIVVKLDVEGEEVNLLEHLISTGAHELISILYVEFHSHFQAEPERSATKAREQAIENTLRASTVKFRLWH